MRRLWLATFGLLELAVAAALLVLGRQLPSAHQVARSFADAEQVTYRAGYQTRLFRQQIGTLRRPELQQMAERLEAQTRSVAALIKSQSIDYDTVSVMRDALGDVAQGIDSLAQSLDPDRIGQLGKSLGETAALFDQKLAPAGAKQRDELTKSLRQAEKGIQDAVARWPEIRKMLSRSAILMRSTRDQLDHTLEHRDELEAQLQQTSRVAETAATLLPLLTRHLGDQLDEQEQALEELGQSIDAFGTAIPGYAESATGVLRTVHWLIWLVAGLAGLHGAYLTASVLARQTASDDAA